MEEVVERLVEVLRKRSPRDERATVAAAWMSLAGTKDSSPHEYVPTGEQAERIREIVVREFGRGGSGMYLGTFGGEWYDVFEGLFERYHDLDAARVFLKGVAVDPYRRVPVKLERRTGFHDEANTGVWDHLVERERPLFVTFEFSPLIYGEVESLARILATGRGLVYVSRKDMHFHQHLEDLFLRLGVEHRRYEVEGPSKLVVLVAKPDRMVREAARFLGTLLKSTPVTGDTRRLREGVRRLLKRELERYDEAGGVRFLTLVKTLAERCLS